MAKNSNENSGHQYKIHNNFNVNCFDLDKQ